MQKPIIYLAAPFGKKLEMREKREQLVSRGCDVQARWIDEDLFTSDTVPSQLGEAPSVEYLRTYAEIDFEDAKACDLFIVLPGVGAGHHAEMGIALALGKKCVVVGEKNCIFHHLPQVIHYPTWDDLLAHIDEDIALDHYIG